MTVPQCLADPNNVNNEAQELDHLNSNNREENNSYNCKTENSSRPGWFGKGYAKVKRPSKKRRLR